MAPPKDSVSSPKEFICGVEGTARINQELKKKSHDSVKYIGMWHTHPVSRAAPSDTDVSGMAEVLAVDDFITPKQLLMIVGFSDSDPELGAYLFNDIDLLQFNGVAFLSPEALLGNIKKVPSGY